MLVYVLHSNDNNQQLVGNINEKLADIISSTQWSIELIYTEKQLQIDHHKQMCFIDTSFGKTNLKKKHGLNNNKSSRLNFYQDNNLSHFIYKRDQNLSPLYK